MTCLDDARRWSGNYLGCLLSAFSHLWMTMCRRKTSIRNDSSGSCVPRRAVMMHDDEFQLPLFWHGYIPTTPEPFHDAEQVTRETPEKPQRHILPSLHWRISPSVSLFSINTTSCWKILFSTPVLPTLLSFGRFKKSIDVEHLFPKSWQKISYLSAQHFWHRYQCNFPTPPTFSQPCSPSSLSYRAGSPSPSKSQWLSLTWKDVENSHTLINGCFYYYYEQ